MSVVLDVVLVALVILGYGASFMAAIAHENRNVLGDREGAKYFMSAIAILIMTVACIFAF